MFFCFFFWIQSRVGIRTSLSDSFLLRRQLLLLNEVRPMKWQADITLNTTALDIPDLLCWSQMSQQDRHTNNLSSFEL